MKTQVIRLDASDAGSIELDDAVFRAGAARRHPAAHGALPAAEAAAGHPQDQGPLGGQGDLQEDVRQKGTGSARHGNKAAPQFRGGGRAFGPVVRSHAIDLPKKVRALALKHALSPRRRPRRSWSRTCRSRGKTKALLAQFAGLGLSNALIIGGTEIDESFGRAARNIPQIDVLPIQGINVYDILRRDTLVLTRAAVQAIEERFNAGS
jgi:large subunit ribosomal protein L4